MTAFLISGFILGLVGSGHCMGMCGPIVLALPKQNVGKGKHLLSLILYNLGRIITYGLLGLIFGFFGSGLKLAGIQQWTSILLGVLMLLSVIFPVLFKKNTFFTTLYQLFNSWLIKSFGRHFTSQKTTALLVIGLLNGLLPCGLVYVALASALESSHVVSGILFMASFGVGTSPLLYAFGLFSGLASSRIRSKLKYILPYLVALVGILFILRGCGLGIKFLSPPDRALEIHENPTDKPGCH